MSTGKFSSGHGKPTRSAPAQNKKYDAPPIRKVREHAGKTEYKPPTKKKLASQGFHKRKQPKKTIKGEVNAYKKERNSEIFQGKVKATNTHEEHVEKRGRAIRKILDIPKHQAIPFQLQNVKNTGKLRDIRLAELTRAKKEAVKALSDPSLDPYTKKQTKAMFSYANSQTNKLQGRKDLALASKARDKGEKIRAHTLENKASTKFSKSKKAMTRSNVLGSELQFLPKVSSQTPHPVVNADSHKPRKWFIPAKNVHYLSEWPDKLPKTTRNGEEGYVATAGQIKKLKEANQGAQNYKETEPDWLEAVTALGPEFGPAESLIKPALKLAGVGVAAKAVKAEETALKGVQGVLGADRTASAYQAGKGAYEAAGEAAAKGKQAVGDVVSKAPGIKQYKALEARMVAKGEAELKAAEAKGKKYVEEVGLRKKPARNAKGHFTGKTEWAPGKSLDQLETQLEADGVDKVTQSVIMKNASDKVALDVEAMAKDKSIIAGAGSPEDVLESMMHEIARHNTNSLKVSTHGYTLRAFRASAKYGPVLIPFGAGVAIDPKFRTYAVRDAEDLVAGFVPSTVEFLRASGDALAYGFTNGVLGLENPIGNVSRIEHMWAGLKKVSPVYAAIELEFDKAIKEIEKRPLTSALEFSGAGQILGKAVGGFGRALPKGMRFGEIGGRSDVYYWGNIVGKRNYSANLFTKQVQKAMDHSSDMILGNVRMPEHINGVTDFGGPVRNLLAKNESAKIKIKIEQETDHMFANFGLRNRANEGKAYHEVNEITTQGIKKSKPSRRAKEHYAHAMSYATTYFLRSPSSALADANTLIARWEKAIKDSGHNEFNDANIARRRNIQLMENLKAHPELISDPHMWEAAHKYQGNEDVRQTELYGVGAVVAEQKQMAPYIPYINNWMRDITRWNDSKGYFEIKEVTPKRVKVEKPIKGKKGKTKSVWVTKGKSTKWRKITEDDVKEHMVAADVGMNPEQRPAMVTMRHIDGEHSGSLEALGYSRVAQKSTGSAIRAGTHHLDGNSLINQAQLSRRIIDTRRTYMEFMHRMALRVPNTDFVLASNDKAKLENLYKEKFKGHGVEAEAVNLKSLFENVQLNNMAYENQALKPKQAAMMSDLDQRILKSLTDNTRSQSDHWVLLPKDAIRRMQEHSKARSSLGKAFMKMNAEFKGSVLAFSLKWHTGNIVDMASRLFFEGAGVRSYATGKRVLNIVKEMDEKNGRFDLPTYHDIIASIMGGHYTSVLNQLDSTFKPYLLDTASAQRRLSTTITKMGRKGMEALLAPPRKGYRGFQHFSFDIGSRIEREMKTAAFGKELIKDGNAMGLKMKKLMYYTPEALTKLAEGTLDANVLEKYARGVNDIMGDYANMSPQFRTAVRTVMPFGLWARAATRFVLLLPAKSPARVAMIASVNKMNQKERAALGLSRLNPETQLGVYPYQRGAIPATEFGGDPGKIFRTNTYTSFGVLNDIQGYSNFILPYELSTVRNFNGENWYGGELVKADGKPITDSERFGIAGASLLQTMFAPIRIGRELVGHGTPSETWSLTSPGSEIFQRSHKKAYEGTSAPVVEAEPDEGNVLLNTFTPFTEEESGKVHKKAKDRKKEKEKRETEINSHTPGGIAKNIGDIPKWAGGNPPTKSVKTRRKHEGNKGVPAWAK